VIEPQLGQHLNLHCTTDGHLALTGPTAIPGLQLHSRIRERVNVSAPKNYTTVHEAVTRPLAQQQQETKDRYQSQRLTAKRFGFIISYNIT